MYNKKFLLIVFAALSAMIGALLFMNFPGATGAWMLDDVGNLAGLASLSDGTLESYYSFLAGGVGSLGRPLSLVTFALQHSSWPDPQDFKIANYLIHAVNFFLVFVLLVNLTRAIEPEKALNGRIGLMCVFLVVAFAWASSPIHQTTVQYVIQRMAMLAAFWMLVGINLWVYLLYLSRYKTPDVRLILATASVLLTTVFAVLSKENGILLPMLCAIIFLIKPPEQNSRKTVRLICINAALSPLYALVAVLLVEYQKYFIDAYVLRDFSLAERVLTQFRIVPLYAAKTLYPVGQDFYLLWDNFPLSKSLLNPFSTLLGLGSVLLSIIAALVFRKRIPLVSIGILFFLAGHSLESSALALELYFEHRNYLPSVGVFIALVGVGVNLPQKVAPVAVGAVAVMTLIFSLITYQEARVWGDPLKQAIRWYESNPASPRTHSHMAQMLVSYGLYDKADDFYAQTIGQFPGNVTKPLMWLELGCIDLEADSVTSKLLYDRARIAEFDKDAVNTISSIISRLEAGQCDGDTAKKVLKTALILLDNKEFTGGRTKVNLHVAIAKLYFYQGDVEKAGNHLSKALQRTKRPDVIFAAAQVALAQNDHPKVRELYRMFKNQCEGSLDHRCSDIAEGMEKLKFKLESPGESAG